MYRTFTKYMRPDTKECCPYTTSDCSYRTLDDEEATFYKEKKVYFHWPTISTNGYTTGGGLNTFGNHQDHYTICLDARGVETRVDIEASASAYW